MPPRVNLWEVFRALQDLHMIRGILLPKQNFNPKLKLQVVSNYEYSSLIYTTKRIG